MTDTERSQNTYSILDDRIGNKRIAKNTFLLYIRLAIVLVISLYTSRVVLNTLGVVDYGIYNVVAGFVSMFGLLSSSLTNSVRRFYNYKIGENGLAGMQSIYITSIYIQLIIAVFILITAETIGLWYINNKLVFPQERYVAVVVVYHVAIVSLLFVVLQIPYSAAIIARERIDYYAIVGIIDVGLKLIIAFITPIFALDNLMVYGFLIAAISFVNFLLYFLYSKREFPELRFKRFYDKNLFVKMLKFSGWNAVLGFSSTVMDQGINLLMNAFFGPIVNAARAIVYQVKGALLGFVMNITTASSPQLTESYSSGNVARANQLMLTVTKLIFLSLYIVALPIMYEIDFVLSLWLGKNVPDYTSVFLIIVLITALVDILVTPISMLVSAVGDIGLLNGTCGVLGLLWIPIAYFSLRNGAQAEQVLLIGLCISILTLASAVVIMQKKTTIRIPQYLQYTLLPLSGTVLLSFFIPYLLQLFFQQGFMRLAIITIVSVAWVLLVGLYVGLNSKERSFVLSYAGKIKIVKKLKRSNSK